MCFSPEKGKKKREKKKREKSVFITSISVGGKKKVRGCPASSFEKKAYPLKPSLQNGKEKKKKKKEDKFDAAFALEEEGEGEDTAPTEITERRNPSFSRGGGKKKGKKYSNWQPSKKKRKRRKYRKSGEKKIYDPSLIFGKQRKRERRKPKPMERQPAKKKKTEGKKTGCCLSKKAKILICQIR